MSAIYLKHNDSLAEMVEAPYEAEEVLQNLLADYPGLLAGDRDEEERRRWLLVSRELGIPSEPNGSSRWSLDHLFLDQEGVPTLVEVKRSSDTRIRREVVGQMLDYAANGSHVWSQDKIRSSFESAHEHPDETLEEFLAGDTDANHFWSRVGTNLKAERLRLVFVADEIPAELQRVVEFLNEQMTITEVLALEIKQYKELGGERVTLVPRLIGQTEAARQVKSSSGAASHAWTPRMYMEAMSNEHPKPISARMEALFDELVRLGAKAFMGSGKNPSINLWIGNSLHPETYNPVSVSLYLSGVAINFDYVRKYRSEREMERLARLAREIPGVADYFVGLEQTDPKWGMRPTMKPEDVLPTDDSAKFFATKLLEASEKSG